MKALNQYKNALQKKTPYVLMIAIIFCLGTNISCKKFVEIPTPNNQLVSSTAFANDASATSVVAGIYSNIMAGPATFSGIQSITSLNGMSADEFLNYNNTASAEEFYSNSLQAGNSTVFSLWSQLYQYIYDSNVVLEGLSSSTGVTASTKQQLEGEALVIRSLCLFYLTNLFGDVPLITTTNYQVNAVASRTPQSQVYGQIKTDLLSAQSLLSDTYVTPGRIRPNKSTATALLARVYLYTVDWKDAALQASAIINDNQYSLTDLNSVFLATSTEAIWQLQPVLPGYDTFDGEYYILTTLPAYFSLTNQLVNSFESGDQRKTAWVDSISIGGNTYYFPYKYKVQTSATATEYLMIFRLAEQYLIRAEAEAEQGQTQSALADLNIIRFRAGLPGYAGATDQASILTEIVHERQDELFCEFGHRWLDLKRRNLANAILAPIKGTDWQTTDQLYPIPQPDISTDVNLSQNPGYN